MSMGRPSKYLPEYCDKAIELMSEGASIYEIAYEFRVNQDTIHEWVKVHPDFSEALKQGKDLSQGWWIKNGRINLQNREFNSTLWYMNMKNRFGWRDKPEETTKDTLIENLVELLKKQQEEKNAK